MNKISKLVTIEPNQKFINKSLPPNEKTNRTSPIDHKNKTWSVNVFIVSPTILLRRLKLTLQLVLCLISDILEDDV